MRTPFLIVFTLFAMGLFSQNSAPFPIKNSDWVATDVLGRTLPTYKETGPVKKDKYVGVLLYLAGLPYSQRHHI